MKAWNGIMLLLTLDPSCFYAWDEEDSLGGFARFFQRILPYRAVLIEALGINLILGLLALTSPFLIQILTDDVLVRGDVQLLSVVIAAVVVTTLFSSTMQLLQTTIITHFSQKLQLGLILEFGRKLLHLPLDYFETRRSG